MKESFIILVAVIVAAFSITTAAAQVATTPDSPVATSDSNDSERAQRPRYGVIRGDANRLTPGAPPTPTPEPPVITSAVLRYEFVGMTIQVYPGNRGILNLTRACQSQFANSRMCTVSELLNTLNVPRDVQDAVAWIRPDDNSGLRFADRLRVESVKDCRGWASASGDDFGLALAFDPLCAGGIVERSCDSSLAVACCAPAPRE